MDIWTPLINALPVVVVGILITFYLHGRFEQVDKRLDDTNRRIDLVVAELAAVRSDLTNVALAVGARLRPEAGSG